MGMYLDLADVAAGHPEAEKELAELRSLFAEWMRFAADIQCSDACGQDWLDGLRARTARHMSQDQGWHRPAFYRGGER